MTSETPGADVRQVMVQSFLDHPTATLPGLIEFGSHVPDDVTDALAIVDRLLADDRLHVALSTPPDADAPGWAENIDRLIRAIDVADPGNAAANIMRDFDVTPKRDVRPRGTATNAERRDAIHRAIRAGIESVTKGTADRDVVRAVADQVLALEGRS